MGRVASPETKLRAAEKRIRELQAELVTAHQERRAHHARADALQRDRDEWKARFDKLLERTPKVES